MMSLTFGPFTQVSGSGPLGPLVLCSFYSSFTINHFNSYGIHFIAAKITCYKAVDVFVFESSESAEKKIKG